MATYKGIQGFTVENLSSDPPAAQSVGQLWYNSTTWKFKVGTEGAGAWSSGTAMNTPRMKQSYVGTQTANLISGGYNAGYKVEVEQFDGTTWTKNPNYPWE